MKIYTIGHSNLETAQFIGHLRTHGIAIIVDVRSKPFSRYNPQYNRYVIAEDLRKVGIPYVWMGHSIGGVPEDPSLLTQGKPDYVKIRSSDTYKQGIEELMRGLNLSSSLGNVAIMCSEVDPTNCHRRRLIGADLIARGVDLLHVVKEGAVMTEHEIREFAGENQLSALDLFGRKGP